MEKYSKNQLRLLPNYFIKIGLFLIVVSFIIQTSIIVVLKNLTDSEREIIKAIFRSSFTIGLFFIAYSRDKLEDEMNYYLRMKSMALTLLFVIVYGILNPFLDYLFNDTPSVKTNQGFVIIVILQYIFTFRIQKLMKK